MTSVLAFYIGGVLALFGLFLGAVVGGGDLSRWLNRYDWEIYWFLGVIMIIAWPIWATCFVIGAILTAIASLIKTVKSHR